MTTYIQYAKLDPVGGEIGFSWDAENIRHLKRHRVTPEEFEDLMRGDPIYLDYQTGNDEERFKVLGATKTGRTLIAVWTQREGKIRAVTAYPAGRTYEKLYIRTRG